MKNKLSFVTTVACLVVSSVVSAYVADPTFVPHTPQVVVTPDKLPILRWPQLDIDSQIDPADLHQLDICTPGVCPQAALDAGAAYFKVTATGIAYYDEQGRLVGTSEQARTADSADTSVGMQALASATTDTEAGVPEPVTSVGAMPGAFEVLSSGAAPTFAQDGRVGGVKFTSQDRFCLDGKRLVNTRGAYGAPETEYRTEIDNFSKVISYGNQGGGPRYFKV